MTLPMMMGEAGGWALWFFGGLAIAGFGWAAVHRRGAESTGDRNRPPSDPLASARERCAQGPISKDEFEHLVADLLRTDHPEA